MTARTPTDIWPFFGLRVLTPRLSLVYPTDEMIAELVALADEGVHSPDAMPFNSSWSLEPPAERAISMVTFHWNARSTLSADEWLLPFVTVVDDMIVGFQGTRGGSFPTTRVASTGSWLGQAHQGQGIGSEMRRAVLYLLFEGLGAEVAETVAFADNEASLRVTEKLGYQPNGETVTLRGDGVAARAVRSRLERADWEATRPEDITIEGLEPCLPLLNLQQQEDSP